MGYNIIFYYSILMHSRPTIYILNGSRQLSEFLFLLEIILIPTRHLFVSADASSCCQFTYLQQSPNLLIPIHFVRLASEM